MRVLMIALALSMFVAEAHAQSAGPPTYSVGDEWTFSNGRIQKVVKVDGDTVAMTGIGACGKEGCVTYFNKDLHFQRIEQPDGTPLTTSSKGFLPTGSGWRSWEFPLEVDNAVLAHEEVATKAGKLKAFKVVREWSTPPQMQTGRSFTWTETVWYAPEVNTIVKYTSNNPRAPEGWELISYSLK